MPKFVSRRARWMSLLALTAGAVLAQGRSAEASYLYLDSSTTTVNPDDTITVNVILNNQDSGFSGLAGYTVTASYDTNVFTFLSASPVLNGGGFTLNSSEANDTPLGGFAALDTYTIPINLSAQNYTLMSFNLKVKSGAPSGLSYVNLREDYEFQNGADIFTEVDGAGPNINLSPAPLNAFNQPIVDLGITVSAVPEPTSLVLLGLGGLGLAWGVRRQRTSR